MSSSANGLPAAGGLAAASPACPFIAFFAMIGKANPLSPPEQWNRSMKEEDVRGLWSEAFGTPFAGNVKRTRYSGTPTPRALSFDGDVFPHS